MPAPSCPRIAGNKPSGSAPESVNSSVWQMPVAFTSTITSPAFGPSSSTSAITSGLAFSNATAARVFMAAVLLVVVLVRIGAEDTKKFAFGILHARATLRASAAMSRLACAHHGIPILVADLAHGFPPVRPIRKKLLVSSETDYTEGRPKPSLLRPRGK